METTKNNFVQQEFDYLVNRLDLLLKSTDGAVTLTGSDSMYKALLRSDFSYLKSGENYHINIFAEDNRINGIEFNIDEELKYLKQPFKKALRLNNSSNDELIGLENVLIA